MPGVASGIAMSIMEDEVKKLGKDFGMEWTGLSYQEKMAGSQTTMLYALSVLVVFLALAALYESWSIPFAVLLVIPLGILGAVLGTYFKSLTNDVYFQVGILAVMGLSSKNAILVGGIRPKPSGRGPKPHRRHRGSVPPSSAPHSS